MSERPPRNRWLGRWEWLPKPWAGRVLLPRDKKVLAEALYVQIMPGPMGTWQIVRVDLVHPFARGFLTPDDARGWLGRAIRAGVVPEGVVELEPPPVPVAVGTAGGEGRSGNGQQRAGL